VFDTHRKALGLALATALILAATAVPGALAQPVNPYGPDAGDAANQNQPPVDLRSPDARDAATRQIGVAGPPTWPARPQPIPEPRVIVSAPDSGLDWGSAGIGAGAVIGASAIALAGTLALRRRRVARPASPTTP
jgi:hypothetical protein